MVLPYMKIPPPGVNVPNPGPPKRSNQTPIGPGHPWPIAYQGIPQHIKAWLPHTTPNLDNNYQGVSQHIKTRIPTNLPPGVNPGSYGFIIETNQPQGIKTIGNPGRINPPAGYTINPISGVVQCGYAAPQPWQPGIQQRMKKPIGQIVPPGVYPDTYNGTKKMSYDTTSSFLIGGIAGFILGAIIFTAAGKSFASATAARVTSYIQPKS